MKSFAATTTSPFNRFSRIAAVTILLTVAAGSLAAQNSSDPAMQKAREETVVVFDLGRIFGYLHTIEKDSKVPALSTDQLRKLYDIMVEIRNTTRLEPVRAKLLLAQIEDRILTAAQLMAVDKLAAARVSDRDVNQGSGSGANAGSSGSGSLSTYVTGGAFNPINDRTKTMGQDFQAFFEYTAKKIGK
jgi:hypothetical protein